MSAPGGSAGQAPGTRDVLSVLARTGVVEDAGPGRVERVGGEADVVFSVEAGGAAVAVKFPGRRRFVAPLAESHNQAVAARAGLAPPVLGFDPPTGAIVSAWIDGLEAAPDATARCQLVHCLAKLHWNTAPFANAVDPKAVLRFNLQGQAGSDPRITSLLPSALKRIATLPDTPAANCHGDPTRANVRFVDGAPCLVDFEYAHRGYAAFDLALLLNETEATNDEARRLLDSCNTAGRALGAPPMTASALASMRGIAALATAAWLIENNGGDAEEAIGCASRWLQGG